MNNHQKNISDTQLPWIQVVSKYNFPEASKSWWQVINSVIPYLLLWVLMVLSLKISYLITLFLAIFAAGFMVRIFIIFHDCGHGSFFKSKRLNTIVGIITGLFTFTPFHKWTRDHKMHHSTVGNLDQRGIGDIPTLTTDEYKKLSCWKRLQYRAFRHPIFLFGIAPMLLFVFQHRFTKRYMTLKERIYVNLTTLAVITIILLMIWAIGLKAYLLIQIPVLYIAAVHGVWLFYVQHQFEDVVWTRTKEWDYKTVAIQGSSYFKLPKLLQWFTGNIGFHHIHHLSPRIPNYKLEKCHKENAFLHEVKTITFFSALRTLNLRLWNEKTNRMVSIRNFKRAEKATAI
jgi:acyl-lipid omega-6 desaturase (Delta-12 desaturase)